MANNDKAEASLERARRSLESKATWFNILELQAPEFASALPVTVGDREAVADRMRRSALTLLKTNEKVAECTRDSILGGLLTIAALGLEIAPAPADQAYLVPFNRNIGTRNKPVWISEAQMIVGYKGVIELARRSGEVLDLKGEVVRRGDVFEWQYGTDEKLTHYFDIFAEDAEDNSGDDAIVGAYMVAKLKSGMEHVHVMRRSDIDKRMRASKGAFENDGTPKPNSPWHQWYAEMARKTPVRHEAPFLPLTTEARHALHSDETVIRWEPGMDAPEAPDHELADAPDAHMSELPEAEPQIVIPAQSDADKVPVEVPEPIEAQAKDFDPEAEGFEPEPTLGSWKHFFGGMSKDQLVIDYGEMISGGAPRAKRLSKGDLVHELAELKMTTTEPVPVA